MPLSTTSLSILERKRLASGELSHAMPMSRGTSELSLSSCVPMCPSPGTNYCCARYESAERSSVVAGVFVAEKQYALPLHGSQKILRYVLPVTLLFIIKQNI